MIERNYYLNKLIRNMWNGEIKVITGIRRCGKSVLLFELFYHYLLAQGVLEDHIIRIELDQRRYYRYRNPIILCEDVEKRIHDKAGDQFYLFVDEYDNFTLRKHNSDHNVYQSYHYEANDGPRVYDNPISFKRKLPGLLDLRFGAGFRLRAFADDLDRLMKYKGPNATQKWRRDDDAVNFAELGMEFHIYGAGGEQAEIEAIIAEKAQSFS